MENYNIPDGYYYNKEHEWVKLENGQATVGVSDYAQDLLTDLVFVELPAVGAEFKQFAAACVVESVKSVSDVYAPLSGKVIFVNKDLESAPEKVNNDPYGEGWIFKLENFDETELKNLMTAQQYKDFIADQSH